MSRSLMSVVSRQADTADAALGLVGPFPTRQPGGEAVLEVRRLRSELLDALGAVAQRLADIEQTVVAVKSQVPPSLLKVAQVAKRLGVSPSTVYNNLIYPDVLPSCRLPVPGSKRSAIRVEAQVLDAFIGSLRNEEALAAFVEWSRAYVSMPFDGPEVPHVGSV